MEICTSFPKVSQVVFYLLPKTFFIDLFSEKKKSCYFNQITPFILDEIIETTNVR